MINIPDQSTKKWSQIGVGEVFGNLYSTRNIDFDEKGYLKLAKRTRAMDNSIPTMLNSFYLSTANIYVTPTTSKVWSITADLNTVDQITPTSGSNPTISHYGDGCVFNGLALFSTTSTLISMDTSLAFTSYSGTITLTSSKFHSLCVFESLNYLAVGDGNTVRLYDTSIAAVGDVLTIPSQYEVTWLVYRDRQLYIGTRNIQGAEAKMFIWNGSGTSAQYSYGCNAEWMFSGCEYKDTIATITSRGEILTFNGGGFTQLEALPVYHTQYKWWDDGTTGANGKVFRRGMLADGERLYIVLSGVIGSYPWYLPNQPSGLWCYNPSVGLYHKAGSNEDSFGAGTSVSSVDTATAQITLGSSTTAITGTPCYYTGGAVSTGMYYIIRVSSTVVKIAHSVTDALAGTAIDLTSTTAGTMYIKGHTRYGAYGFQALGATLEPGLEGAIAKLKSYSSIDFFGIQFMWSSKVYTKTDSGSAASVTTLQTFAFGENRGDFVTQKIFSTNIEDVFNEVIVKAGNIFNTNDKVVVKYRTTDRDGMPISTAQLHGGFKFGSVLWTSSTTFTTNANNYAEWKNVAVGDEVAFFSGGAAGWLAHITDISESSGVFTVTIDETYGFYASGDSSNVAVQNWTKLGVLTSTDGVLQKEFNINEKGNWIQFKFELRGVNTRIEELQVINKTHLPS